MMFGTLCVLFILFRNVFSLDFPGAGADNFGPFTTRWHHHKTCRGPKSKNETFIQMELGNDGEIYGATFNITVYTTVQIDNIKISVYTVKAGVKQSQLWTYKLENPCQHLVIGALMESKFGIKNCMFKKGLYYGYINYTSLAHEFFGNSFFYGEFLFKAIILSKTGNIGCVMSNINFLKEV